MSGNKQSISVKGAMDFDSLVAFLEDLVSSFKQKTVCIQRGDEFVTLKPTDPIEMEVEATVKKGKQKLNLELAWREELAAEPNQAPFKVSATEPEPKPEPVEAPAEAPCDVPIGLATPAGCDTKAEAEPEPKPAKAAAKAKK